MIYNFCSQASCSDGVGPNGGHLTEYSDGTFYGLVQNGGAYNSGAVFQVSTTGTYSTLYSFCALTNCDDGDGPASVTLALGGDGKFYGTTSTGAANDSGNYFQVTPAGSYTDLYDFCVANSCTDGGGPTVAPLQTQDGKFWGTAGGGANEFGEIYSVTLSPAVAPAITITAPSKAVVGKPVTVSFAANNAFSTTAQQCNAFATNQTTSAFYPLGRVTATLASGIYSGSITGTPATAGTYLVAVTCGGVQTATTTVDVVAPVATTTTLSPSAISITSGQGETFTVTVTAADSSTINEGIVAVRCNGLVIGTNAVSAGTAILTGNSSEANAGTYNCAAYYSDSTEFYLPSHSSSSAIADASQSSSVALNSASYTVASGTSVTLTATVTGQYATPTIGYVRFRVGNNVLGTVAINSSGVATFTGNATAAAGTYNVHADYLGTGITLPSTTSHSFTITP